MDVVELANKVFQVGRRESLHDTALDELYKHLVLLHVLEILGTGQLDGLLLLLFAFLLFLLSFTFLFLAA